MSDIIPQKCCSICHKTKARIEFYAKGRQCKECLRAKQNAYRLSDLERDKARKRAAYVKNREAIRAKQNADRKANPEKIKAQKHASYLRHREHVLEHTRAYRLRNPEVDRRRHQEWKRAHWEAHCKKRREYTEANREYIRISQRNHRRAHPEIYRAKWHKRRARLMQVGGSYTPQQIQEQYKRQKGKCYYCSIKLGKNFERDHVVPLSRGGTNDISNIVLTCEPCNAHKQKRLPHEWPEGGRLM